jgi:lauroyl/myristoyl acyltransferase
MNALARNLQDLHYRFFDGLIKALGGLERADRSYALAETLGALRTRFGYVGRGWSRQRYLETIRTFFPHLGGSDGEALLKSYWINHQKRFVELFLTRDLNGGNLSQLVKFEGLEHLDRALARGRSVILPVPHLGNERLHHIALAVKGYPVAVISSKYEDHGHFAQSVKIEASKRFHEVGYPGDSGWLLNMLKGNRVLQVASTAEAGSSGVFVNFLGQDILLPGGWVRLALMSGAPVLPSALLRQENSRHVLTILPEFEMRRGVHKDDVLRDNVQRFMEIVATLYRRRPDLVDWMSLTVRLEETRRARENLKSLANSIKYGERP